MDSVYEVLQEIKKCPNRYLERPSLELLYAFIGGFISGHHAQSHCLQGFNEYVAGIYKLNTDHNWAYMIWFFSPTDEYAFYRFFEHLEDWVNSARFKTGSMGGNDHG